VLDACLFMEEASRGLTPIGGYAPTLIVAGPSASEVDQGWTQLMAGLNVERLILAATMLGIAQRAFDDLLLYVKGRRQFDRPIGSFQALQHRISDLATDLQAARLIMERLVRTSLISTIYGGTSEIQRTIIAKTLGL
jgi:alkylation response protein AidB-like acyl-CoA dehydrogenase